MDVSTIKNFRLHDALCYLFGEEHSSKWDLELSDPNVGVIATRWDMEEAFPSQTILDSVYAELIKQDLLTNKTAYKRLVDEQAGEARKKYITDTAGQSQVYIFKLAEAKRYKDAVTGGVTSFDPNEYPYLYAELGITGSSITEIADTIINNNNIWNAKSAEIERVRLDAKRDIDNAVSLTDIESIMSHLIFP